MLASFFRLSLRRCRLATCFAWRTARARRYWSRCRFLPRNVFAFHDCVWAQLASVGPGDVVVGEAEPSGSGTSIVRHDFFSPLLLADLLVQDLQPLLDGLQVDHPMPRRIGSHGRSIQRATRAVGMPLSDRGSHHLLVQVPQQRLHAITELVKCRLRRLQPIDQPLDRDVLFEILEPLNGLRPPLRVLVEQQLEQQIRAVRTTAAASVGAMQRIQSQFLVSESSDPTHGVVGIELAVQSEPFG